MMKGLIYSAAAGIAIAMFLQGMHSIEATNPIIWRFSILILTAAAITFLISSQRQLKQKNRDRHAAN
jgi:hypothetical protein